ncbi:RimJ/RimL family protein N-acetyltransferase [Paraburkholderia sp. BL6669N2]|uniref:GNAT family N-acetyltransferase n=1 Tax=Paraburkholderia sp. BL6669N2 TaxID=1938807 RepID=UPI000E27C893|nr:GNAT family protein [Paraburkholderia sp. BL6669N2]REG50441.1 RimJ/RimL family protein N-acetyltransferase [Paraburkholderia sp. BL6669N2]
MTSISTKEILLRDFRWDDLSQYQTLRSDPKFQRFYSEEDSAPEKAEELLGIFISQSREAPRTKYQLAVVAGSGDLMGSCGLRIESPGHASIGCELGRRWHRTGTARFATDALLTFGFVELGVQRIFAETISENKAAIKLCQSIGMSIESERVNDRCFKGRTWSTTTLAIRRDEWQANHPQ